MSVVFTVHIHKFIEKAGIIGVYAQTHVISSILAKVDHVKDINRWILTCLSVRELSFPFIMQPSFPILNIERKKEKTLIPVSELRTAVPLTLKWYSSKHHYHYSTSRMSQAPNRQGKWLIECLKHTVDELKGKKRRRTQLNLNTVMHE